MHIGEIRAGDGQAPADGKHEPRQQVGEVGDGLRIALRTLDHTRVTIGAQAIGIARAETEGAQLVVLQIDTPGGLDVSMRQIIKAILASDISTVSNSASTTLNRAGINFIQKDDEVVTGTSNMVYGAISVNRNVWNQIRDDADFRAKQKATLNAGMVEKVDFDIFANASARCPVAS